MGRHFVLWFVSVLALRFFLLCTQNQIASTHKKRDQPIFSSFFLLNVIGTFSVILHKNCYEKFLFVFILSFLVFSF